MQWHTYLAFVLATSVMIALPGPSVLLTVAHSLSFGWKRALATVAGETAGIAVQIAVAAVGMASLLSAMAEAFEWLRLAGAAYLIYLGVKLWLGARQPVEFNASAVSTRNLFTQGLVVTIFNPKSLVFIAAFLPQFMDGARPLAPQFAVIVPTFLFITFTVTSVWALVTGKAGAFLRGRRAFKALLRVAGGLMILAGAGLALARRGN